MGHGEGLTNVLDDTFDTIRLFEGKVAHASAEALRGINGDGIEVREPCLSRWASWCEDELFVLSSRGLTETLDRSVSQHSATPPAE